MVAIAWILTVQLRLMFAPYALVDENQGPIEALSASWGITKGRYGALLLLALAGFGVVFVGALALIVGVFPAVVILYLAFAAAYRQMSASSGRGEPASPSLSIT